VGDNPEGFEVVLADDEVHFVLFPRTPVGERMGKAAIREVDTHFTNHQVFERAPVLRRAARHFAPANQTIGDTDVEEVELRRRHGFAFARPQGSR
jgi:hypothetical protein